MAQKKISQLPNTETVVLSSDLIPIVNDGTTKNIILSAFFAGIDPQTTVDANVRALTGFWDSVYTSSANTSASWDSVYSSVANTSASWDSVYSSVTNTSASWDSVYSSVANTSASWDSVYSSVANTSANWDSVYTSSANTSANWDSVYSSVANTSADWNLAFDYSTDYSLASSTFATNSFVNSTFLPLTGGTVTNTILLTADISSDLMRITQIGSGNAIVVEDSSNPDSSPFVVTGTGNVGIGTGTPTANLVVVGTVQEGNNTIASGSYSHAEGTNTTASGTNSHSQGSTTIAFGNTSHAAGYRATATHDYSYAWSDGSVGAATSNTSTTKTGQYMVSASGGVFFPGNVGIGTDDNSGAALTVVGSISASGNYKFGSTSTAPSNTTTPVTWVEVYVGATSYKMPLYQ